MASWTKYWVALCGAQLYYYPAKSLKATERKHVSRTKHSHRSITILLWAARGHVWAMYRNLGFYLFVCLLGRWGQKQIARNCTETSERLRPLPYELQLLVEVRINVTKWPQNTLCFTRRRHLIAITYSLLERLQNELGAKHLLIHLRVFHLVCAQEKGIHQQTDEK